MPSLLLAEKAVPFPYAILALSSLVNKTLNETAQVKLEFKEGTSVTDDKQKITFSYTNNNNNNNNNTCSDASTALRDLASSNLETKLYGPEAAIVTTIDHWLDFASGVLSSSDFRKVSAALDEMDHHLTCRSFFVGYRVTLADIAVWGALRANAAFVKNVKDKTNVGVHLVRWFQHISSLDFVQEALDTVNASITSRRSKKDQANYEINLNGATVGNVVTRFPPEPSGYLHIGHAKAALLNQYFAQMYKGKLIIRFDDTNPSKEKIEFEDSINEDLALIGVKGDVVTHTSDYFDKLYELAKGMIKDSLAYVDDTPKEKMAEERFAGIASKCRDLTVEENLARFDEMFRATEFGLTCCVRAKMSISDPNKCLRDPVIYRCNITPHHRTGTKWKIYPTYDFACPVVDSLEGVTHALRTNEYRDRNPQYQWFLDNLKIRQVHIWDFARMNFVYTLLSKRKLQWFVDQGIVSGWDDPRFPTVRGIRRRGMTIQALKEYIVMQGPSTNAVNLEWDKLWALNRKVVEPNAARHTRVLKENIVKIQLTGGPKKPYTNDVPKHKKVPELGTKKATFSSTVYIEDNDARDMKMEEEITLMNWGNAIVTAMKDGRPSEMRLNLDGDYRKTKKIHWLSVGPELVHCELVTYDYLINKPKLEDGDDVKDFITPFSEFKASAYADESVRDLKRGDIIQFERCEYCIVDVPYSAEHPTISFIVVPSGTAASTASKGSESTSKETGKKATKEKGEKAATKGEKKSKKENVDPKAPKFKGTVGTMYLVKPLYGELEMQGKVGKMYTVKNIVD